MAKKFISATYKSKKITLPDETVNFCPKEIIFRDLCIEEMNFIAMDKIFCLGQNIFVPYKFEFVLDKTCFLRADGMGIWDIMRFVSDKKRLSKQKAQAFIWDSL